LAGIATVAYAACAAPPAATPTALVNQFNGCVASAEQDVPHQLVQCTPIKKKQYAMYSMRRVELNDVIHLPQYSSLCHHFSHCTNHGVC